MSLECKEENIPFYKSFGYEPDGQYFMVLRYKEWALWNPRNIELSSNVVNLGVWEIGK